MRVTLPRLGFTAAINARKRLVFPEPFGELEAFQTSGGTSTLPQSLLGKVTSLDYKTIRYRGHCAQIRLLVELGLCDALPRKFPDGCVTPRRMLADLLEEKLDLPGGDALARHGGLQGFAHQFPFLFCFFYLLFRLYPSLQR